MSGVNRVPRILEAILYEDDPSMRHEEPHVGFGALAIFLADVAIILLIVITILKAVF